MCGLRIARSISDKQEEFIMYLPNERLTWRRGISSFEQSGVDLQRLERIKIAKNRAADARGNNGRPVRRCETRHVQPGPFTIA